MTQGAREKILNLVGGPHTVEGQPQCHFPNELYSLSIVAMLVLEPLSRDVSGSDSLLQFLIHHVYYFHGSPALALPQDPRHH